MARVSIIVPVYNVEKYLTACIDSLIYQTFKDIEIILVNDGSTDTSPEICNSYVKKDGRIKVIHKKNGGLSDARNCGAKEATTQYILFVDSDDYIDTHLVAYLYEKAIKEKADIVTTLVKEYRNKKITNIQPFTEEKKVNGKEALKMLLESDRVEMYAVGKLYKKELVLKHPFPLGKTYEDAFTIPGMVYDSESVYISTLQGYNYIRRDESITLHPFRESDFDCIEAHTYNLEFVKKHSPNCVEGAEFRYWWSKLYVLDKMIVSKKKNGRQETELIKEIKLNKREILSNSFISKNRKRAVKVLCLSKTLYKLLLQFRN